MLDKIPNPSCRQLKGRTKFGYLWDYQNGNCFYCKEKMEKPVYKGKSTHKTATFDHVKPKSEGGRKPRNLVLACRICNSRKGSLPAYKFVELVRKKETP